MAKKSIEIDGQKLDKLIKEKGFNRDTFGYAIGVGKWSVGQYCLGHVQPAPSTLRCMCLVLNCTEDDLVKKEPVPVPVKSAVTQVIENKETADSIARLEAKIDSLASDLGKLASIILDIQKVSNESKAQEELNRDELAAIFNKLTDVSSTCNKVLGNQKHRY